MFVSDDGNERLPDVSSDDNDVLLGDKKCKHHHTMCLKCGYCRQCHKKRKHMKAEGSRHKFKSRQDTRMRKKRRHKLQLVEERTRLRLAHVDNARLIRRNGVLERKVAMLDAAYGNEKAELQALYEKSAWHQHSM